MNPQAAKLLYSKPVLMLTFERLSGCTNGLRVMKTP